MTRGFSRTAWIFYTFIVFEILFMISPFALYYYSAYGLPLEYLQNNKRTAWLVQFILPHYSYSGNTFINRHNEIGWLLIMAGLILFIGGFCQIYHAKILRKKEVSGGLYRFIRHPQYVSLAILGLGTFLVYPRFIILITFVSMIFIYTYLARMEEKECLEKFGGSYADYMATTGMFFPRLNTAGDVHVPEATLDPRKGTPPIFGIMLLYAAIITSTVVCGFAVRNYSLSTLASFSCDSAFVISLVSMRNDAIKEIYETILRSDAGRMLKSSGKYLVYILPEEWHVPELPVSFQQEHVKPDAYGGNIYKVLIASAVGEVEQAKGEVIFRKATGFNAHALVYINKKQNTIVKVVEPPRAKWTGIAAPLF